MRINDDDFPTLAELVERLELRELERLAWMMRALWPNEDQDAAASNAGWHM